MKWKEKKKSSSGFILIPVLGVLLLATVVVLSFGAFIEKNYVASLERQNEIKHAIASRNIIEMLLAIIRSQKELPLHDKTFAYLLQETGYDCQIEDESGKINCNILIDEDGKRNKVFIKIFSRFLHSIQKPDNIINALLDWIDKDTTIRTQGAEYAYYAGLEFPYQPRNDYIEDISELDLVRGFNDPVFKHYVTIYSSGKININTASREVLQALSSDITESIAQSIIDYRSRTPFLTVSELKKVPRVTDDIYTSLVDVLTVTSSIYRLIVQKEFFGQKKGIECYVQKKEQEITILSWKEY